MLNCFLNMVKRCEIGMLVQRSYNQWAALRIHANLYLMTPGTEATCPGARPGGHLLVPPQPRPRRQPRTRPRPATPARPLGLRPYTIISTRQYLHYNIYTLHNRCQHRRGPCHPNPCRHGGQCHYSAEAGVTCLKKNISQKNIFSQNILKKMFSRIFRKNIPPKK